MAETKKVGFLQAKGYTQLSSGSATATPLGPGERLLFDEENPQHKAERKMAESGDPNALFQFVEVDLKAEADQEEERVEQLAKAEKIAAEARQEAAQAEIEQQEEVLELREKAQEEGQPAVGQETDFPPQDERAQALAAQSGDEQSASAGQQAEQETPKRGRRSGRS